MRIAKFALSAALVAVALGGCLRAVEQPPRVDLAVLGGNVGVAAFGDLAGFLAARAALVLSRIQGVRAVELGTPSGILTRAGATSLTPAAAQTVGQSFGVNVVVVLEGDLSDDASATTFSVNIPGLGDLGLPPVQDLVQELDLTLIVNVTVVDTATGQTLLTAREVDSREVRQRFRGFDISGGLPQDQTLRALAVALALPDFPDDLDQGDAPLGDLEELVNDVVDDIVNNFRARTVLQFS